LSLDRQHHTPLGHAPDNKAKKLRKYKYLVVNQSKENDTKIIITLVRHQAINFKIYQLINNLVHPKK
jgi:hypothetical protein